MYQLPLRSHADLVRSGALDCETVARDVIGSRNANEAYGNTYQTFDEEEIRRQARTIDNESIDHPLKALPVSVKDAYGVGGYPTYGGTRTRLPARWARDTGIVRVLRECGALFTGKTQMVEFALGGLGHNPHWGAPVNPWDDEHERLCGGSSCGAGVSLWDGTAAVALAADIAGSVRVPASMSGVVGLRPTQGLWHFGDSYLGICPTLDGPGIMTLSVADAAFFFGALQGGEAHGAESAERGGRSLKDTRVGFSSFFFDQAQPDIAEVARLGLETLSKAGARLIEVSFPEFQRAYDFYTESSIAAIECAAFVDSHFPDGDVIQDPLISGRLGPARAIHATTYFNSLAERGRLMKSALERMEECDVFVTPTLPISPPPYSAIEDAAEYTRLNRRVTLMTNPVNVLGLSSLTMPVGKDASGMPVGLQFVGRPHGELELLLVALGAERVLGAPIDVLGMPPRLARG